MKNYILLPAFSKCPNSKCGKTIQRIGVYKTKSILIGFTGGSCAFCGFKAKIDINNMDLIPDQQKRRWNFNNSYEKIDKTTKKN